MRIQARLFQQPAKDISGTWVGKRSSPMDGEMEFVYEIKVRGGTITGAQRMPFGDSPIVDGRFTSPDEFELIVETGSSGDRQRATAKGKVNGDALEITPAMPAFRGGGPGGPGGGHGGPGARPEGGGPRPGGPGVSGPGGP